MNARILRLLFLAWLGLSRVQGTASEYQLFAHTNLRFAGFAR